MFIDSKEMRRRLSEDRNLLDRLSVPPAEPVTPESLPHPELDTSKFKNDGSTREKPLFSMGMRAIIGASACLIGPKKTSEVFDVNPSYASALSRGTYSSSTDEEDREKKNQELRDLIYEELGKVRQEAQNKLLMVLGLINEDTLKAIEDKDKARLASLMANQLSAVIDRTIQKQDKFTDQRSSHLHLYAPETRPLSAFEIKKVNPPPEMEDIEGEAHVEAQS